LNESNIRLNRISFNFSASYSFQDRMQRPCRSTLSVVVSLFYHLFVYLSSFLCFIYHGWWFLTLILNLLPLGQDHGLNGLICLLLIFDVYIHRVSSLHLWLLLLLILVFLHLLLFFQLLLLHLLLHFLLLHQLLII